MPIRGAGSTTKTPMACSADWFERHDPGSDVNADPRLDDSSWPTLSGVPGRWKARRIAQAGGIVWYRRSVTIPDDWAGKDVALSLGPIDTQDTTWFNGQRVGGALVPWDPRRYTVPGCSRARRRQRHRSAGRSAKQRVAASADRRATCNSRWRLCWSARPRPRRRLTQRRCGSSAAVGWLALSPRARHADPRADAVQARRRSVGSRFAVQRQDSATAPLPHHWRDLVPGRAEHAHRGQLSGPPDRLHRRLAANDQSASAALRHRPARQLRSPIGGALGLWMGRGPRRAARRGDDGSRRGSGVGRRHRRREEHSSNQQTRCRPAARPLGALGRVRTRRRVERTALQGDDPRGQQRPHHLRSCRPRPGRARRRSRRLRGGWRGPPLRARGCPDRGRNGHRVVAGGGGSLAVRYAWDDDPVVSLFNEDGLPASPFRTDDWPQRKRVEPEP